MKKESKNFLPEPERSNTSDHIFITNTHIPELRDDIKKRVRTFYRWAYIDHEPDDEDGTPHTHFYIEVNGSYKLKTIANRLGIEPNFVQFADNPRTCIRYLTHIDFPDKKQYNVSDIITNFPSLLKTNFVDQFDDSVESLFADLDKFFSGVITREEFINLHIVSIQKMPFMNQVRLYSILRFSQKEDKETVRYT